ncbi:MAG: hypothetical protein CMI18_12360 [Opitutaceae bacterium]|nr:hypothetical protein [Opitutaceae bacterium]
MNFLRSRYWNRGAYVNEGVTFDAGTVSGRFANRGGNILFNDGTRFKIEYTDNKVRLIAL